MAFPFKTGGDFYNCEAQRMRLHNLGANPTETATGLMYFNTGASNLGKHAVVHDGTDFKALAFVDEIATNADFVELKEKVDLLIGDDVDTDTIIDSWKEVQAFLADIEDTKTLQGMLSSYLPKSGGTITAADTRPLVINSIGSGEAVELRLQKNGVLKADIGHDDSHGVYIYDAISKRFMGINIDGTPYYYDSHKYTLLHAGNYSSYALPLSGGTISNKSINFTINRNAAGYGSYIKYTNSDGVLGYLGVSPNNEAKFIESNGTSEHTLLHSGNYSDYALPLSGGKLTQTNNVTSLLFVNTTYDPYISFQKGNSILGHIKMFADSVAYIKQSDGSTNTLLHSGNIGEYATRSYGIVGANYAKGNWHGYSYGTQEHGYGVTGGVMSAGTNANGFQINGMVDGSKLVFRGYNASGFTDWKTIAFTDSTVAAATRLEDGSGKYIAYVDTNNSRFYIGDNINSTTDMYLLGKNIQLRYGTSGTTGLLLNSSGNVGIGTTDPLDKLHVEGRIRMRSVMLSHISDDLATSGAFLLQYYTPSNKLLALTSRSGSTSAFKNYIFTCDWDSGNVSIGGIPDTKAKLHVAGDLYVDGNIIATKEVSAGGAGQEGEIGDGGAEVISQQLAKGQSTYTITNTIKRSDIAVSLYEANVINGQTIWSLCLADIEVTNDTITVTFGSATSVNHKLVAVG